MNKSKIYNTPPNIGELSWEKMGGMIPVITQDIFTGEILMQAYVNKDALEKTLRTGNATYYSRSKKQLWEKGLTSGNIQKVYEILTDCDKDSLIYKVKQLGNPPVACHTGEKSCFYTQVAKLQEHTNNNIGMIFNELYNTLEQRKVEYKEEKTSSNTSYTAKLLHEGIDAILKKIGEESIEIIIGAKKGDKENMIYEISDFLYFLNVLMIHTEILPSQIANELSRRFGISGIEEKNSRNSIHE